MADNQLTDAQLLAVVKSGDSSLLRALNPDERARVIAMARAPEAPAGPNPELARLSGGPAPDELSRITPVPGRLESAPAISALSLAGAAGLASGGLGAIPAMGLVGLAGAGGAGLGLAAKQTMDTNATPPTIRGNVEEMAKQGALAAGGEGAGRGLVAGAQKAAPYLMTKALKPTTSVLAEYNTTAPELAKTLLNEGVNVTEAGVTKLQTLLNATNEEIRQAIQSAPGSISKKSVAARALPTAQKISQQVNPTKDLQAVGDTVGEFLDHPVVTGPTMSVPEAQAMKVGTYRQIGKKYGEVSAASVETQKALARGLKEDIASEVPGIANLNKRDSELMAALDATGRRVAVAGNRDPVGFAWVTQHPTTFLAALLDRSPAVKSLIARGLWSGAGRATGVSPQMIRAAVVALTTAGSDDAPAPASDATSANP